MKKVILTAIITCVTFLGFAQVDTRKRIDVNGSAKTEITPDEIYVNISLKEYFKDNKRKVAIEDLEKQLQSAALKAGIAAKDFTINNVYGYATTLKKKKDPNYLASKQYTIKFKDLNGYNDVIAAIDDSGIAYTNIIKYSHSNIEKFKQELRAQALKNARDKAVALLQSVGEQLGGVLYIQDYNSDYNLQEQNVYRSYAKVAMASDAVASEPLPDIDFKKIELNYSVNATFEIK